jgi:hypothetical protein
MEVDGYRESEAPAAFLSPSLAAMILYAPCRLGKSGRRFVKGRIIFAVTIAASAVMAPALAQNSEPAITTGASMKSKLKTPAGRTLTVKVTNWREADLVELQVVESGSADWKKVLGALKAGQWTWAKVPQSKNCHVSLRGKYADGTSADLSNVDICADKTVDLVN